jgi:hypothetical protein
MCVCVYICVFIWTYTCVYIGQKLQKYGDNYEIIDPAGPWNYLAICTAPKVLLVQKLQEVTVLLVKKYSK